MKNVQKINLNKSYRWLFNFACRNSETINATGLEWGEEAKRQRTSREFLLTCSSHPSPVQVRSLLQTNLLCLWSLTGVPFSAMIGQKRISFAWCLHGISWEWVSSVEMPGTLYRLTRKARKAGNLQITLCNTFDATILWQVYTDWTQMLPKSISKR